MENASGVNEEMRMSCGHVAFLADDSLVWGPNGVLEVEREGGDATNPRGARLRQKHVLVFKEEGKRGVWIRNIMIGCRGFCHATRRNEGHFASE